TYGEANPALDATVSATVLGDALNYSLATTATPSSGVGDYPISLSPCATLFRSVSKTDNTLSVGAKDAAVSANHKTKTYGEANPALDATVSRSEERRVGKDSIATSATPSSGVGDYPISVTLGANPNYTVSKTDNTLSVGDRNAEVSANHKTKTYGEANPALDATVSGTVLGDALNYSLATTATPSSGVGDYPISVTLGANPNYTVSKTDNTLSVGAKDATESATDNTDTDGNANPALDATVS